MKAVYSLLKKHGLLVGLILGVVFLLASIVPTMGLPSVNAKILYAEHGGSFEPSVWSVYILTFLAGGLAAIFGVVALVINFKKSYKVLVVAAAILVVYIVTSFMGDGSISSDVQKKFPTITADTVSMVDGTIYMFYAMLLLGIAAALFSSVKGLFSR